MTALFQESAGPRGAPPARFRTRRAARRAERRRRLGSRLSRATTAKLVLRDPLARPRPRWLGRLGGAGVLVTGSVVAHAVLLALFGLIGQILSQRAREHATKPERLEVTVLDKQPAKTVEPPAPSETRKAPAPPAKPAKVAKNPEPPPDPINQEPSVAPEATPRRIVGLSLSSTVTGGGGPSFAVGNTRMGATDRTAADPTASLLKENRVSNRIPTAHVSFKPPVKLQEVKPAYPPALRAQGIEADVVLVVTVGTDGGVERAAVVKGPPEREFVSAAIAAAEKERYAPATRDGIAVEYVIRFTVRFRLTDY